MRYLIMAAAILMLTIGCADDATGPDPGPVDYIPLAVGNQWNNDIEGFSVVNGDTTTTITGTVIREITGTATHVNGNALFVLEEVFTMIHTYHDTTYTFSDTTLQYLFKSDSLLLFYDAYDSPEYQLVLKFPPIVGDAWIPDPLNDPSNVREVVSLTESAAVPAGSFTNCLLTEDTDAGDPDEYWRMYFAGGVGPVKFDIREDVNGGYSKMTMELTSYIVN